MTSLPLMYSTAIWNQVNLFHSDTTANLWETTAKRKETVVPPLLLTSAFESLYGGSLTLSTQLIKLNYLVRIRVRTKSNRQAFFSDSFYTLKTWKLCFGSFLPANSWDLIWGYEKYKTTILQGALSADSSLSSQLSPFYLSYLPYPWNLSFV